MGRVVLIVDDDINAQIIAETLLRLRGLEVRVTADAAAAHDIMARDDVGVVVVDLNLPGTNGFEMLRRLRDGSSGRTVQPRIVVVIQRTEPEVERFGRRIGADVVLRKPLEPGQFIATVERLLATNAPRVTLANGC